MAHDMSRSVFSDSVSPGPAPLSAKARVAQQTIRRIALVAALGIGLGFVMQALVVTMMVLGGGPLPGLAVIADLARSVTWSVLVCTGVAIGVSIGQARAALAGLVGMIFAPLGLAAAKAVHKVMLSLIDALDHPAILSLGTIGTVRALEYGALAWVLTLLIERKVRRARAYVACGVVAGVVFGGGLTALTFVTKVADGVEPALLDTLIMLVAEVSGPIGCALVIYLGQFVVRSFKFYARQVPGVEARN